MNALQPFGNAARHDWPGPPQHVCALRPGYGVQEFRRFRRGGEGLLRSSRNRAHIFGGVLPRGPVSGKSRPRGRGAGYVSTGGGSDAIERRRSCPRRDAGGIGSAWMITAGIFVASPGIYFFWSLFYE